MPCQLSHRASAQAPVREGIWSFVISCAPGKGVTNSLKSLRAAVYKSVPCYTTELSWPPANDTKIWMTCRKQFGFTHHSRAWGWRDASYRLCCRIPEQECWGVKQDYPRSWVIAGELKRHRMSVHPSRTPPQSIQPGRQGLVVFWKVANFCHLLPGNSGWEQPNPKLMFETGAARIVLNSDHRSQRDSLFWVSSITLKWLMAWLVPALSHRHRGTQRKGFFSARTAASWLFASVLQGRTDPVHNTLTSHSHLQHRSFTCWSSLYVSMRCFDPSLTPDPLSVLCS